MASTPARSPAASCATPITRPTTSRPGAHTPTPTLPRQRGRGLASAAGSIDSPLQAGEGGDPRRSRGRVGPFTQDRAMPDTLLDIAADSTGRIPVLDIGPYLAGEPGALMPLAAAIARTCE